MAKQKTAEAPAAKEPPKQAMVHLQDRAGNVQLKFLAREVRMRDGRAVGIKSGVATVRLTAKAGEIAVWGERQDEGPTAMITSEGYRKCNQVAGITVVTPARMEMQARGEVANPYIQTNERTGAYEAGWVRKIAIGPTPMGTMAICDRTTYLSLVEYMLEDLIGIAKRNPCAAVWGVRDIDPAELLADAVHDANEELRERAKAPGMEWLAKKTSSEAELKRAIEKVKKRCWAFFEVEHITGQGIWFDRTADAVATMMGTYVRAGKFGVRKLEAIAYRNVLSDHPLMPKKKVSAEKLNAVMETVKDYRGRDKEVARDWWTDVQVFFHETVEGREDLERILREFESGLRTAATVVVSEPKPERASVTDDRGEAEGDEVTKEEREEEAKAAKAKKQDTTSEKLVDEPEPAPAAASTASTPDPTPDERAALIAELHTTEEVAGKKLTELVLSRFPTVKTSRAKATLEMLRAYGRALEAAINERDNPRE